MGWIHPLPVPVSGPKVIGMKYTGTAAQSNCGFKEQRVGERTSLTWHLKASSVHLDFPVILASHVRHGWRLALPSASEFQQVGCPDHPGGAVSEGRQEDVRVAAGEMAWLVMSKVGSELRSPVPTEHLGECTSVTSVIRGWGRRDRGSMELIGQTVSLNREFQV